MTIQDAKTVSDEIEKDAKKIIIIKVNMSCKHELENQLLCL